MTRDLDLERDLDRFFIEGPLRAPDDAFTRFVARIERVPQRRLVRLHTKVFAIDSRFLVAAAVIVILVAGFSAAFVRAPSVGVGSSPSPLPSASAGAAAVPEKLQGRWIPVWPPPADARFGSSSILISWTQFRLHVGMSYVDSSPRFIEPGRLALTLVADSDLLGCHAGDQGSYTFDLSTDGLQLTLSPVSDACAPRAEILAPTWTRVVPSTAIQRLSVATLFRPFGPANGGQFSFTVPAGWTDQDDTPDLFVERGNGSTATVSVLADAVPFAPDGACAERVAGSGVAPTAIASWLAARPGLVVTPPAPVVIGGLGGVIVDLSAVAGRQSPCPQGEMIASADGSHQFELAQNGLTRYVLLDRGDGHTLMVAFEAQDSATWNSLLPIAMSMIDSFQFSR